MPDGARPGEMIVAASDGRWLGGFDALEAVPYVGFSTGQVEIPVGWTWVGNSEGGGCDRSNPNSPLGFGCTCSDCCGLQFGLEFTQRTIGQIIDPCLTSPVQDNFGVAYAPQGCVDGCQKQLRPGACFCIHPADTLRCASPTPVPGTQGKVGYPLTNFAVANPSAGIEVVTDGSGPPGLADLPALQIDFLGLGAEGASFVGENGGYDPLRPSPVGGYSSSPVFVKHTDSAGTAYITEEVGIGTPGLNTGRSNTGISVFPGDCLTLEFWVKAVPDRFGFICDGYNFFGRISSATGQYLIPPSFTDLITLNGEWQHVLGDFSLNFGPPAGPDPLPFLQATITLMTQNQNRLDPRSSCFSPASHSSVQPPRGRVLVKAVHLYPCSGTAPSKGWHVKRRSGHRGDVAYGI